MRWLVVLVVSLGACSGSHAPPPAPSGPPAPMTASAAGDVQIATVTVAGVDRPVWASCASAQAARGASKADAVNQCIDFELMAIEAEQRGYAIDHDVVLATKTALVSELVAHEYEDKFQRPEDFGTFWTKSLERNRGRFDHGEARGSVYARIDLAKTATPADDEAAKKLIDELYAALANERGLMRPHLEAIAKRVIGTRGKLSVAAVPADLRHGRLHETYVAALFAIPQVGRVAPPVRTPWGWDIILWDSVVPEVHATPAELLEQALPEIKRSFFPYWVARIGQSLGVKAQLEDKNLPLMENL